MILKLKYIIKKNLYHIFFGIFILVVFILLKGLEKTLEMRMKFIAYYKENENRRLLPANKFFPHIHGVVGQMRRLYWDVITMRVFKYPFLFWFFFGVSILQLWYFKSSNYKFFSLDFLIYVIIILLSRISSGVGVFGAGWLGGIIYGLLPELILVLFTSLIMMKTNPKLYSSGIHYPSLNTLIICCIIISLLTLKGFFEAKNEINNIYKQYSNTGFVSYALNAIHKTEKSITEWDKSTHLQREKKLKEWFEIFKYKEEGKGNTITETLDIINKDYFWNALGTGHIRMLEE